MVLAAILLALAFTCGNCWFYMHHYPFFHHHHHRFPPLFVSNCQDDGNCKMCLVNDVHWCLPCGTYKLCGDSTSSGSNKNDTGNKMKSSGIASEEEKEYIETDSKSKQQNDKKDEDYVSDENDKDVEDKKDNKKNKHINDKETGLTFKKSRSIACEKGTSERGTNVNEDRLGSTIFGTSTTSKFGTVLLLKKDFGSRLSSKLLDSLHNGLKKGKSAADHCQEVKNLTEFEVVPTKPPIEFNSLSSSVIPQLSAGNDTN